MLLGLEQGMREQIPDYDAIANLNPPGGLQGVPPVVVQQRLGNLSFSYMLRRAFPNSVFHHTASPSLFHVSTTRADGQVTDKFVKFLRTTTLAPGVVQQAWANIHLAPRLESCVPVAGGWAMWVMLAMLGIEWQSWHELWQEGPIKTALAIRAQQNPQSVVDGLLQAMQDAHGAIVQGPGGVEYTTVHGDLTEENIYVRYDEEDGWKFMFTGFDWSGYHNHTSYPAAVKPQKIWLRPAGPGTVMRQQDDLAMLGNILRRWNRA